MNPPRRWPLDPCRKRAPPHRPGRFAWKEISTAPRPFRPGRSECKNPGAAVAAPGVEAQQPNQNVAAFAVAQAATLKAFLIARCANNHPRQHNPGMPAERPISIDVIRKALERSGYLMKSRVVRMLAEADFFVEPNVTHKGPHGAAQGIDLTAEAAGGSNRRGVCVKTTFVIQTVNNVHPIVLLTERPSTPNADFESYIKFGTSPAPCPFLNQIHPYEERAADWHNLFSEICVLDKLDGGDEFTACRSDGMRSSLLKASQYTEDEVSAFGEWVAEETGRYWRLFFWHPIVVVSGQLLTAKVTADGTVQLQEVPLARLEFNWHDGEDRKTTVMEVVREDFLLERLDSIRAQDDAIEARIHAIKLAQEPETD